MTRQLVAILPDGRCIGIVLDSSPMSCEQVDRFMSTGYGARLPADAAAIAQALGAVELVEVVHRPHRRASTGYPIRNYPPVAFCRTVAA